MDNSPEETLDPEDWQSARALAHQIVDDAVSHLEDVRSRTVWQEMPEAVRATYDTGLPQEPQPLEEVYREATENMLRYPMGNIHPRFWGWYMGSSNFTGALADFIAAVDGSNLGGGNTAASATDRQVVNWLKEMLGFPASASGTLTSGGSMANMVALTVARNVTAGVDVLVEGVTSLPQPLRLFYTSDQAHSCHQKAMETLGLGSRALCFVASDAELRMDISALEAAIAEDRTTRIRPICVIATAGTTNTGSIDDVRAIAEICRPEGLWLHVDGCIGALIKIAPLNRDLAAGSKPPIHSRSIRTNGSIRRSRPAARWCGTPRNTLERSPCMPSTLRRNPGESLRANISLTMGSSCRAGSRRRKIRMSLKEQGVTKFGRLIDQNIAQGAYLTELIEAEPSLEMMAPTAINIVCFRYRGDGGTKSWLKQLNTEIMLRLQEAGTAVVTDTTIRDRHCLRVAINNHRTRREDLDLLIREVLRLGQELEPEIARLGAAE